MVRAASRLTMPGCIQVDVSAHEAPVKLMLFITLPASTGHVEVEEEKLGLLGAVAGADGADQFGGGGSDAPYHAAGATRAQFHQVTDELASAHVPQLHCTVVRGCDHETVARLQASHRRLVLVRS